MLRVLIVQFDVSFIRYNITRKRPLVKGELTHNCTKIVNNFRLQGCEKSAADFRDHCKAYAHLAVCRVLFTAALFANVLFAKFEKFMITNDFYRCACACPIVVSVNVTVVVGVANIATLQVVYVCCKHLCIGRVLMRL